MPDLTGHTEAEARRFLERAGLRSGPAQRRDMGAGARAGTIVAQRPESGYPVRSGDLITLTVAGGGEE
jgi:beta-lactam-binding protein with PASTA domain